MTRSEVSELVAILMSSFPNSRFPVGTVVAYETFLVELERDRAREAIKRLVKTSKFMPTIAEVFTAYEDQRERIEVPYHRPFLPPKSTGRPMAPGELKAAIDEFLNRKVQ